MEKFLIIRFSSIGDIVLTSPIIRCLRTYYPDSKIHFITKSAYAGIPENNPHVDRVITIEKEIDEVVDILKQECYDFVIDLHNNLRSTRLKKKLGRPTATFPKLNFKKYLLTNFKINRMPDIHVVERYFDAVSSLGVEPDGRGLDYFIPKTDEVDITDYNIYEEYIVFSIGAQFATKRLPNHKIIEIIQELKTQVVLLGGISDVENGEKIASSCENVIDLTGKLNLSQSASVIRQASAVITHDTGLMHIAAAFRKKIISIWGNTVPDFGMYPYMPGNEENYSIHEVEVSCRPCSKIGYQSCPKKHFKCMEEQDVEGIVRAVLG